jgi:CHAT domain-containing protein/predicted negative regulator of RcsB-dependent stress response
MLFLHSDTGINQKMTIRRANLGWTAFRKLLLILGTMLIWPFPNTIVGAPPESWPTESLVVSHDLLQGEGNTRTLEIGKPIERELARSDRHSYQIGLKANELLHIVVEQRGINVIVSVFGPSGQGITEIDSPNGANGPEPVSFISDVVGNYVLNIYSLDQTNPSGRYEVRIEEQREATPQDRKRMAAFQSFQKGKRLLAQATARSLRESIANFNEALSFWRLVEDSRAEAITLGQMGKSHDLLGEKMKALDLYNQALLILQATNDRSGEATTLNNIGLLYDSLGERQKALIYYNRALPILQTIGDRRVEAYTLSNIGLAYDSLGEKQKALDNYKRALQMLKDVGDRQAEAATLNNIGFVYNSLDEKEKALDYFDQALSILRAVGDHRVEAITINNIGYVHESLGDKQKALEYFNQALPILRVVGDRRVEAVTLNNIGLAYASLGDRQKALDYFNRSLPIRRAVGDRQGEAITLGDIGYSYAASGEYLKASDYYNQALSLSRAVEDRSLEASVLRRRALVARDRGDLLQARTSIEAALEIIESLRTKIVSQELRASYFASAQQYFEAYIDVLMQLHSRQPNVGYDGRALQVSERARARSLLEMLTEAGAGIRQGVDPDLLHREHTMQQMLNAKAAAQDGLMQSNHGKEELVRLKNEIKLLLAQYNDIEAQIRVSSPRYAALTQPSTLSVKDIQRRVLDPDTVLLEYSLAAERSYLWMLTSSSLTSVELPRREEVEVAARRVYELLTERKRRVKFETAAERQTRITAADAEYLRQATALSQILLGPVAKQLTQTRKRRLIIVADGALNYVPFASLPLPQVQQQDQAFIPLMVDYEIVSLPSASILDVLRRETAGRKPAPKTLAVLADPVFEKDDAIRRKSSTTVKHPTRGTERSATEELSEPLRKIGQHSVQVSDADGQNRIQRLLFTRHEADEILSLVPESERLEALDFNANRMLATNPELGHYRFVHFATHGVLDTTHPELSGIVLSLFDQQGREQDGYLRVHEIFNLKLPVELVVLSGCRTGLGKEIRGEGLIGLTRGFMYAGAARVMVSLWDVSDEASAKLMAQFYKGMLGKERLSPAAALRAAQIALWKQERWQAPYYWAAFVLQGEPG